MFVTLNLCTWQGWTNVAPFDFVTLYLAFSLKRDWFLTLFNFAIAASDYHSIVFDKVLKIQALLTDCSIDPSVQRHVVTCKILNQERMKKINGNRETLASR